jgi:hypothetical protein
MIDLSKQLFVHLNYRRKQQQLLPALFKCQNKQILEYVSELLQKHFSDDEELLASSLAHSGKMSFRN